MVSVYCLAYNHGRFIREALEGFVMQQTTFDYEVFVHDDCSTDDTAEVIREYAARYPGIIKPIFQKENQHSQGVNIFLSVLLPRMTGRYIAICEGDDCWTDPLKLQKQVTFLEEHPEYVAVFANVDVVDENNVRLSGTNFRMKPAHEVTFAEYQAEHYQPIGQFSSLMHRNYFADWPAERLQQRSLYKGNGDVLRSFELMAEGRVYFMGETFSKYRRVTGQGDSWSARTRNRNMYRFYYLGRKSLFEYAQKVYGMSLWGAPESRETLFEQLANAYGWARRKRTPADLKIAAQLTADYVRTFGLADYCSRLAERLRKRLRR